MKRLIVLMVLFLWSTASADFLGVKKSTETISFFLEEPLDSISGTPHKPDSVHVFAYADNGTAATYTARSTTYPFSDISLDTLKINGDTTYVFADAIGDLDGAGGNFELAIVVRMFTGKWPTDTRAIVQVVTDSLNQLASMNDSLEAYDNAGRFQLDIQEALDTLQTYDATGRFQLDIQEILDTLQTYDNANRFQLENAMILDTLQTYDDANRFQQENAAILDTLQLYDGRLALADTTNAILDSLQLWDDNMTFLDQAVSSIDGDVWTVASRQLTAIDEDVTAMDLNATTIGTVTTATSVTDSVNAKARVASMSNGVIADTNFAGNAITAAKIADDAIDYGTFAATAPTAWWNEGKTGYGLTNGAYGVIAESIWVTKAARTTTGGVVTTNNDKTGYGLSTTAVDDIWDEDSTGHWTSPNMAFISGQTSASSLDSAAVYGAMVQAITDSMATIDSVIDLVWDEDSTGHWTSPNMAFVAGQTAASTLDSGTVSRIVGRKVWGVAAGGVGSDDSTATNARNIDSLQVMSANVVTMNANTITSAQIASGAIGASQIADGGITATEIADDAIDFATFAGTAPTAWWPEGKTGYALSGTQTFNNTGTWTGNLSGSVGSVTGAVGSVTGAVGSVTAQVTANVNGIAGSAGAATNLGEAFDGDATYAGTISNVQTVNDNVNVGTIVAGAIGVGDFATGAITADAIGTDAIGAAEIAANAIGNTELADSLYFDSLNLRTFTVSNSSGDAVHFHSTATGGVGLYIQGSGTSGEAIKAAGVGADFNATLNLDDVSGDLGAAQIADDAITAAKIANNAIGITELADSLYFDSLNLRTFTVSNSSGDAVHFHSSSTGGSGLYVQGSGTSGIAIKTAGVGSDIDAVFDTNNFADAWWTSQSNIPWAADTLGTSDSSTMGNWQTLGGSGGTATVDSAEIARAVWDNDIVSQANRTVTATATVDTASVARSVWDNDIVTQANRTTASTSGSGAYTVYIYVKAGSTYLQNASVRLATAASGGTSYYATTNSSGRASFALGTGTYYGWAQITNYSQNVIPDTYVVATSNYNDTLLMTAHVHATPGSADKVTIYAYTDAILGDTLQGAIMTAIPRISGRHRWTGSDNRVILPRQEWATSDSTGYVEMTVYATEAVTNEDGDSLYFDIQVSKQGYPTWIKEKVRVYTDSTNQMIK